MKKRKSSIRRNQLRPKRLGKAGIWILFVFSLLLAVRAFALKEENGLSLDADASSPAIKVQLLSLNEYSRPGIKMDSVKAIVIHYTANPGSSAKNNRDYFESLKDGHERSVSSHFVIGLKGEIIQCVPLDEIAYASNSRNHDTISIECCHPDETGKFTKKTYRSIVTLTAWLCEKFALTEKDVIRHYDVNGKICPKYFVEHEDAWEAFRADVKKAIKKTKKKEVTQSKKGESCDV